MATHIRINDSQMIRQYKRRHLILEDGTCFIHLDGGLADIFTGVEWLQFSRYRYAHQRWHYIAGHRLTADWLIRYMPQTTKRHVRSN